MIRGLIVHRQSGIRVSRLTLCLLGICLLAFALRLFSLDTQSIWWDEAISVHLARSSLAEIVANRSERLHPPLYFFLLKGFIALAGDSAFSVRFLSAWFSLLLVPALYAFGRRWLDRRAGLIAAAVAACSPLYLAYAQEARVYALLPLIYLALLAHTRHLTRPDPRLCWRDWLILAVVEALGLAFHYMSLFAVAYVLVTLIVRFRSRRTDLIRLLVVQGLVVLLLLPWLLAVIGNASAVSARVGMSNNWQAESVTLVHYLRLLWTFQLTGLTALVADPVAVGLTTAVALVLAVTLTRMLITSSASRPIIGLLLDWLIPLSSAFIVWCIRPLSHPRYVILFTPALLLLVAHALNNLLGESRIERGLAILFIVSLAATSAWGLFLYHTPRFAKDDTRGVATATAAHSTADDLVLVPPEDWSIPYYYDGQAQVEMIWPGDNTLADWERLAVLTREVGTVFLVDYYRATRDPRSLLLFALESAGYLSDRWNFKGLYVRVYRLESSVAPPVLTPAEADFGSLRLIAAWIEPAPASDTGLAVALRWRMEKPDASRYRVGLRLRDAEGWGWAAADDWLLDETVAPTERWPAGKETTTYHILPLMAGTPPLTYTLTVGVYREEGGAIRSLDLLDEAGNPRGQSYDVGDASLAPACGLLTDPYSAAPDITPLPEPAALADGLLLEAAALDRQTVAPGQPIFVSLRWRRGAGTASLPDLRPTLTLIQGSTTLVAVERAPAGGRYPTDRWEAGEIVLEHRGLTIPPTAADGPATLALDLGACRVILGSVEIAAGEHNFTPPPMAHEVRVRFGDVAELLGYDLSPGPYTSDQPVSITLYWRALEGAATADYTVFAHILAADGHLVGQHDGPPAAGGRPTPGWLPGEIIADQHEMAFREPYTGQARIEVGLYDSDTLERVPTESGETFVLLPDELTVSER